MTMSNKSRFLKCIVEQGLAKGACIYDDPRKNSRRLKWDWAGFEADRTDPKWARLEQALRNEFGERFIRAEFQESRSYVHIVPSYCLILTLN